MISAWAVRRYHIRVDTDRDEIDTWIVRQPMVGTVRIIDSEERSLRVSGRGRSRLMNSTQLLSLVYVILSIQALAEAADSVDQEALWSWVDEGEDIGEALKHVDERPGLKKKGFEPSGIAYHPKRKTLFVVSDDGPIAELAADGTVKNYWHSAYYDREGIAYRLADGCLYVINNGPDHRRLEIFDPENGKFEVVADLDGVLSFGGKTQTNTESLAWIPPDGTGGSGFFLVGNKTDNRLQALVLRPEGGVAVRGKPLRIEGLPDIGRRLSLADLSFDARSRRILAVFSPGDLLVQIDLQGRVLETFRRLRAPAPEGLAIGPEGSLYIGCDNLGSRDPVHGTVLRFRPVADAPSRPSSQRN